MNWINRIPLEHGHYISGFTDGEGSFNVSFKVRQDYKLGVKITSCFNISQKEKKILAWIKSVLKCGTIRARGDGMYYYEVQNLTSLHDVIVPFFKKYRLRSQKQTSFNVFSKIVIMMHKHDKHLDPEGILEIFDLREKVDVARKRKYNRKQIIDILQAQ